MTTVLEPDSRAVSAATWRPRTAVELLSDQLSGINAWNQARAAVEATSEAVGLTREERMDLSHRREVVRCVHEALVERADLQLLNSPAGIRSRGVPRVVVAHRNEWFRSKIVLALDAVGMDVIASVDNGAAAVGTAIAEQPDLVLVEDKLAMMGGEQVTRHVLRYCSRTVVAAQVATNEDIALLLDAGASEAFARRVPPEVVAEELGRLLAC